MKGDTLSPLWGLSLKCLAKGGGVKTFSLSSGEVWGLKEVLEGNSGASTGRWFIPIKTYSVARSLVQQS